MITDISRTAVFRKKKVVLYKFFSVGRNFFGLEMTSSELQWMEYSSPQYRENLATSEVDRDTKMWKYSWRTSRCQDEEWLVADRSHSISEVFPYSHYHVFLFHANIKEENHRDGEFLHIFMMIGRITKGICRIWGMVAPVGTLVGEWLLPFQNLHHLPRLT